MKKKLFNVLCTLLICILAFAAVAVLFGRIQHRITFIGGHAVIWVLTGSMEDTIPQKSYILIREVKDAGAEISVGDVITFYSNDPEIKGQLNTHRVKEINVEKQWFITKGDNNTVNDPDPVPFENTVGKYVRTVPVLTAVGRFLMTTGGFVSVMALLFVMVCVAYVPDIVRSLKKPKEEKSEHEKEIDRLVAEEVERLKQQNTQVEDIQKQQNQDINS